MVKNHFQVGFEPTTLQKRESLGISMGNKEELSYMLHFFQYFAKFVFCWLLKQPSSPEITVKFQSQ